MWGGKALSAKLIPEKKPEEITLPELWFGTKTSDNNEARKKAVNMCTIYQET